MMPGWMGTYYDRSRLRTSNTWQADSVVSLSRSQPPALGTQLRVGPPSRLCSWAGVGLGEEGVWDNEDVPRSLAPLPCPALHTTIRTMYTSLDKNRLPHWMTVRVREG